MKFTIIYLRTMITTNERDYVIIREKVNSVATAALLFWLGFIIIGIFTLVSSFSFMVIMLNILSIMFFENTSFLIVTIPFLILMIYSNRYIVFSIIDLKKNRRWTNPTKFIKHILIQVAAAIVASITAMIIYGANYFTDNLFLDLFLLFNMFILVISSGSIVFYIYYLYLDYYVSPMGKWENYERRNM